MGSHKCRNVGKSQSVLGYDRPRWCVTGERSGAAGGGARPAVTMTTGQQQGRRATAAGCCRCGRGCALSIVCVCAGVRPYWVRVEIMGFILTRTD
eukprot:COSAG01_NODE_4449_length_5009_cov_5.851731_9_plen_95_part_00